MVFELRSVIRIRYEKPQIQILIDLLIHKRACQTLHIVFLTVDVVSSREPILFKALVNRLNRNHGQEVQVFDG